MAVTPMEPATRDDAEVEPPTEMEGIGLLGWLALFAIAALAMVLVANF